MAGGGLAASALFGGMLLLSVSGSLGRRDCTGVDCPLLENCIEEVLESGDCCASCLQTGCTCEGYQYYDCVNAGFRNGKVPEGESYFVDFGSTECSCPMGGGRIGCHFIPCPEIPANCIKTSHPADGCAQCERVGCIHHEQKYEAGHTFHMDPCQVCHCPTDGGDLMCYPILECNPQQVQKPVLATTTEDAAAETPFDRPYILDRDGAEDRSSTLYSLIRSDNLPPSKNTPNREQAPPLLREEDEEEEEEEEEQMDYDYSPMDTLKTPQFLATPTEPPVIPVTDPRTPCPSLSRCVDISAKDLVEMCCDAGHKWASDHRHCVGMRFLRDDSHSVCRISQERCCLAFLKESSCLAGMNAAKAGDTCDVDRDTCGFDSYQCCNCCTLGLNFRARGQGCEAHQHLGYPCGHVFLTCCEEEDGIDQPTLRRKEKPEPTALPKRVSDSGFPNQAFSIQEAETANSVEEPEDIDECQRFEGQQCHHKCINTWGSYLCACFPGYHLLPDGYVCVPGKCLPLHAFTRLPCSSSASTLPPGNGPCAQQCAVEDGQARCSCFPGFALAADGRTCEDVNECQSSVHGCSRGQVCVNAEGSFRCAGLGELCAEGFVLNVNGECVDVDECAAGSDGCAAGFECQNTVGSFSCNPRQRCFTGFTQDAHGNCIDIDECVSVEEPCNSGFNCINTVGSYTCQRKIILCSQGYHVSEDGARCVDVDECHTGVHRCGEGQICQNLPGTYRCDCQTGYQYDMIRRVCVDVNECWRYPGRLCAQTCENSPGSYRCSCTAGFTLAYDGKNCEDVNECNNNPCSQECANIYGSYQCYCRQGFYLKEDGHTCEDIDECSQSIGHLCAFRCVNVPGSYQCACPPHGYSMSPNGRTCRDIDECSLGAHNCSATETCYNIQGSFRCLSFSCPQNYRRVSDTRCERISCPNFMDCQNSPLRITYYQLSFQTNILIPAQIFRIGPSPAYSGDNIIISITRGNEENYFSTRKLNAFTGAVYLQRQVREPRDFLIDVEMKLLRQGTFTTFLARIYVFITTHSL
uniref:Fibulin 2 n=1 Tax=Scleropages formosus TaxID=113540 RepID=A0A8C9S042_SCLFO